ncbi:la-related protein 6C [Selaginella moellendorffii]|uniref:la-related protein 6C n=1 Tax=Selaginella moellendorffii TaxID=88036 RepID=UPI000D1C965E|nr:la-related protein 6C [Selaginella moellendorffii]|eukprot:XP_002980176.2 la-related protein 6C [Selaginella moellendorffii]
MQQTESSSSPSRSDNAMTAAAAATTAFAAPKHNKVVNRGAGVWVVKSELAKAVAEVSTAKSDSDITETQKGVDTPSVDTGSGSDPGVVPEQQQQNQTLTRQISLSKLNAGAPVFVPKATSPQPPPAALQPGQPGVLSFPPMPVQPSPPEAPSVVDVDDQNASVPSSSQKSSALSEDTRAQVVQQVEFYFSDANLPTDNYLMKFIKKDPEGFVPIPIIGSFRKIKQLTKNYGALAAALRSSSKLVVSEDGKKVRRAEPLADIDLDEIQGRTVVAENLPEDHSIQSLEKLFGTIGSVKMVRVCEPGSANSVNNAALAKHSKTDRVVSNKLHALVEYETLEQAEKAVAELTDQRNWRSGLHVRLLLRRMYPASKHNHGAKGRKSSTDEEDLESKGEGASEASPSTDETTATGAPDTEKDSAKRGVQQQAGGRGRGRGGRGRGRGGGGLINANGGMLGTSPQISCSPSIGETMVAKPPPGPRMPDGTRGFSFGRGSGAAATAVAKASQARPGSL